MLEYPGFCYLDVEKTGSTFIRNFLLRNVPGAPLAKAKHSKPKPLRGDVFYFTSCRDPLEQYRSLYAFGSEGKGGLRDFQEAHKTDLFETYTGDRGGFHAWLELILSDRRQDFLTNALKAHHLPHLGLMSTRFLRLNLRQGGAVLRAARSRTLLDALWLSRRLPAEIVHQENLREDLAALVRGPLRPFMADAEAALDDLATSRRINTTSDDARALTDGLPPALEARLRDLEWFHYRHLGYR